MPMLVHLDLSELLANPLRSGIQRVEREAIRHWPGPARLVPCCIDGQGRLLRLDESVWEILRAEDPGTAAGRDAELAALAASVAKAEPVTSGDVKRLLNLELFFASIRADAHLRLAAAGVRVLWYLYDFLPFLRPDLFPQGTSRHCMHFLRGLRSASAVSFLSEQTRRDYLERVARRSSSDPGPVLSPGADGLRLERQSFTPARRDFVAIGTIEPRKNPQALLSAFELLWAAGRDARLTVAGRIAPDAKAAHAFFARHAGNPNLVVLDQPGDETLRSLLRQARAVVMPSEAEGFGLPPYEALFSGIPAIASAYLPSASMLPRGAKLLERMDAESIATVVTSMLDDTVAAQWWAEAAGLSLPTWADFGRALGGWAQAA